MTIHGAPRAETSIGTTIDKQFKPPISLSIYPGSGGEYKRSCRASRCCKENEDVKAAAAVVAAAA